MTDPVDTILAEVIDLSKQLADESLTPGERTTIEERRDQLRETARLVSLEGRHPASVELQIEALERRRNVITAEFIKQGYSEKHIGKRIQDPGAYSAGINRRLEELHAAELADIDRQLELLRSYVPRPDLD
ncbi:MAG: hypothetical protein KDB69_01140 [Acidimicrobiia bacterium]|nr:hypothetical protein [Acidimicrobiia bacterium]